MGSCNGNQSSCNRDSCGPIVTYWGIFGAPLHSRDVTATASPPGGRLNKKDGLSRYGDSHVKDKTS